MSSFECPLISVKLLQITGESLFIPFDGILQAMDESNVCWSSANLMQFSSHSINAGNFWITLPV